LPDALCRLAAFFGCFFGFPALGIALAGRSKFSLASGPSLYSAFFFHVLSKPTPITERMMDELPAQQNTHDAAAPIQDPHGGHIVLTDASINPEEEREKRKAQRRRKFRKAPPWIEALCAVLLVVITGCYTFYAARQANAAKKAARAAYDAIEEAKLENLAAITAQKQIAQSALDKSQRNFDLSQESNRKQLRLDQRAWIGEVNTTLKPTEVGKPICGDVHFVNSGKTVAKHLFPSVYMHFSQTILTAKPPKGEESKEKSIEL
jgi:hypothetical protein